MNLKLIFIDDEIKKCDTYISEYGRVSDIKKSLATHFPVQIKNYYQLNFDIIFKPFILNEKANYLLKSYKIGEKNEIWIGKLENYLSIDDVIVEVFVIGWTNDWMYLIMNKHDNIGNIRSIMESIIIDCANADIYNIWGTKLENEVVLDFIDEKQTYRKIIFDWSDSISRGFEDCCNIHDQEFVDRFWGTRSMRFGLFNDCLDSVERDIINDQIQVIGNKFLSFIHDSKERLDDDWTCMPSCFLDSQFLFCDRIADRFEYIIDDFWDSVRDEAVDKFGSDKFVQLEYYFHLSIHVAILDYLDTRLKQDNVSKQSMRSISSEAIRNCLIDTTRTLKSLLRSIIIHFSLKFWFDFDLEILYDKYKYGHIDVCVYGRRFMVVIPMDGCNTNFQIKQTISWQTGVSLKDLFMISHTADDEPKDDEIFDINDYNNSKYVVEIICSDANFVQINRLKQGLFGSVFLYGDKYTGDQIVFKRSRTTCNIYKEIRINSLIRKSVNLNLFKGIYRLGDDMYLGIKYLSGGTLTEYITKRNHLQESEIAKLCHEILAQIKELHDRNIIHRDIKSDNIVLDDNGCAKLIDFGISKYNPKMNYLTGVIMSSELRTINYAAPEFLNGENYNISIDIWSYGAVVTEMITGHKPFYDLDILTVTKKIIQERKIEFNSPEPLSIELKEFINCCLQRNPRNRSSADQLMESPFIIQYYNC